MNNRIIVIGGGFGGLATSLLLSKKGYSVSCFEKNDYLGGRVGYLEANKFKFDTGPSWLLMPEIFDHFFSLANIQKRNIPKFIKLTPAYKVFYEDGDELEIITNNKKNYQTFNKYQLGGGAKLKRYLEQSTKLYKLSIERFLYNNFDKKLNFIDSKLLIQTPKFIKFLNTSLDKYVSTNFNNQKLKQILEFHSVFLGASPYKAPSIYSLMSHLDFIDGVYYPENGMYSLVELLKEECIKAGVKFYLNSPLQKLSFKDNKIVAAQFKNQHFKADIFISNTDPTYFENNFLPQQFRDINKKASNYQYGPSAILILLGIKGKLANIQHHNLFFVDNWQKSFDTIFKDKQWPNQASMYVSKTSATDKTVAPKNHENIFVLIPGPAKDISDEEANELADEYLKQLAIGIKCPDLTERVVYKKVLGPKYFSTSFNSPNASALGLSHTLSQSAFFRTKNKNSKLDNLFHVGANTLPGIGLPMCLISAELVYKHLTNDYSIGPILTEQLK